jgi:hypothetical protein
MVGRERPRFIGFTAMKEDVLEQVVDDSLRFKPTLRRQRSDAATKGPAPATPLGGLLQRLDGLRKRVDR